MATLLANCTSPSAEPGRLNRQTSVELNTTERPSFAGNLKEIAADAIIVSAPIGERHFDVTRRTRWLDRNGQPLRKPPQANDAAALFWTNTAEQVGQIQLLPPISATDEIPTDVPQPPPTAEHRMLGSLPIITRAGWGAAPREWVPGGESGLYDPHLNPNGWREYEAPVASSLHTLIIHHSALEFNDGPQAIQALHMRTAKFADVGYHYLIDGLGQLYEGRPINVRGAHTGGFNTGYIGICLLGNFEVTVPPTAQTNTLMQLCDYLRQTYELNQLGGHRDFQPGVTVCPGRSLHPLLPNLAARLGLSYTG